MSSKPVELTSKLLRACDQHSNPMLRQIVRALHTGTSAGEICSLRRNQVNLDNRVVTLTETKNGSVVKGTDTASSDIDLLVVADDLTLETLYFALAPVETGQDRKLSPTLYTRKE